MALSSGTSVNVNKTALDDVFAQGFSIDRHPELATAEDAKVFNQLTMDKGSEIVELLQGSGLWTAKAEAADVASASPRVANQKVFTATDYANSIDIPRTLFDDLQHNVYEKLVKDFGMKARRTQDFQSFAPIRTGFDTATTADGVVVFSNSHAALDGSTIDNLETAQLDEAALNTAIVSLGEQKGQDGVIMGFMPSVLLVPMKLYKTAAILSDSELRPGTGNNDANVYLTKYGVEVRTTPYLGANAGGSDVRWSLQGFGHSVNRYVRQAVETTLVPFENQRNNAYIYKGNFREVAGVLTYEGIVGSNGTV